MGDRTVTVAGLFKVGASFAADGALITSDQNFLRLFPRIDASSVSLGLVQIEADAEPVKVKRDLEAHLPDDVQVFTSGARHPLSREKVS